MLRSYLHLHLDLLSYIPRSLGSRPRDQVLLQAESHLDLKDPWR